MGSKAIKFHQVHGNNIRISSNGAQANRVESFNQGLCFTDRPLAPEEKLVIKIVESCKSWSGTLRVGVTANNPSVLAYDLPKYVCPDLNMKPGCWGKALEETTVQQDKEIVIYYKRRGVVMIQIANHPPEEFISGIPTSSPLYVLFDVYGNTKGIRIKLANNSIDPSVASTADEAVPKSQAFPGAAITAASFVNFKSDLVAVDTKIATRRAAGQSDCFAVTQTRLVPGRTLIVYLDSLLQIKPISIVLTNEDSSTIHSCRTLERLCNTGYSISFESECPRAGEELAISLAPNGAVYISHNNRRWLSKVHVDETVEYHVIFSMETVSQLRMIGVSDDLTPVCEEPTAPTGADSSGIDCIICLETSRNVLLEPCNHFALCEHCARSLMKATKRECPVCRSLIAGVRKIYVI